MRYRRLGKTELMVSEIGLGAEWLERHNAEECRAVIDRCGEQGINILDCWMPEPNVRSNIGAAIRGKRGALVHPGPPGLHLAERPVCADPGHGEGEGGFCGSPGASGNGLHRPGHDPLRGPGGRAGFYRKRPVLRLRKGIEGKGRDPSYRSQYP